RTLLQRALAEVEGRGQPHGKTIPLGMMIEVPSAAVMADVFATVAEFFSLGTNDLLQYALAVDRTSRPLAQLASPVHPSILRLVRGVANAARDANVPVAVCGAVASDLLAVPLLVGLGLRELSMEAAAIPEIKAAIGRVTVAQCEAIAKRALAAQTVTEVDEILAEELGTLFQDLLSGTGD